MAGKIKILHVVQSMRIGGITTFISSIIEQNANSDSVHDLMIFKNYSPMPSLPCRIIQLREQSNVIWNKVDSIEKEFEIYDFIFVHSFLPLVLWVLIKTRRKCFLFQHGMSLGNRGFIKKSIKTICYSIIPLLLKGKVVCATEFAFKKLRKRFIMFPRNKIEIIPFGISMDPTYCQKLIGNACIIKIGLAGRLAKVKRFDLFLNACASYSGKMPLQVLIAGDGPEANSLKRIVQQIYNNKVQVTFLGTVRDMDSFYCDLDLFVLPSKGESFGLVVLEALHHKVPVLIFTNAGSPVEMIKDNVNGFVIEDSKEALGAFLNKLSEDVSILTKLRENLKSYDMDEFHIVNVRKNLELAAMKL